MADCTNCWLPLNACICGQRRPMLAGGIINPEDDYDDKGTDQDPLKGQHDKYKGFMKKHAKMGEAKLAEMQAKNARLAGNINKQLANVDLKKFNKKDEQLLEGVSGFLLGFLLAQPEFKVNAEFLRKYECVFSVQEWYENALANCNNKPLPFPNEANWDFIKANRTRINILRELVGLDETLLVKLKRRLKNNPLYSQL